MVTTETKSTTTSQSLQAKTEEANTPFFDKEGGNSVFTNDSKESHFFDNNSSNSNQKTPFFSKPFIQTKLTIGQPGDKYEQEADSMADQVVQRLAENNDSKEQPILKNSTGIQRKPIFESDAEPAIQAKPLIGQSLNPIIIQPKCAACEEEEKLQKKEESDEDEQLQMKPIFDSAATPPDDNSIQRKCVACAHEEKTIQSKAITKEETLQAKAEAPSSPTPSLESRLQSSKGSGSSLSKETRSQMEGVFGTDFSGVRVHTDSSAVQMNKDLGAQAFTHGSDVYFNTGKYDTGSREGQRLLGHELTHTVQQGASTNNIQKNESQVDQSRNNQNAPSDPYFTPTERGTNQSPSQFQQKNKSEVKDQLTKETDKAASESPVKAKIEEGKPTVLIPEKEENPSEKTIELDTTNEHQSEVENFDITTQNKGKPKKKEKPKKNKRDEKGKKDKKEATTIAQSPVEETTQLPEIPEDSGVQAMRDQANQEPSQTDIEEQQNDTRSEEEKLSIQSQLAAQFQTQHQLSIGSIQNKIEQETNKLRTQEQTISESIKQEAQLKSDQIRATIAAKKAELQAAYQQSQAMLLVNKQTDLTRLEQVKANKLELLTAEMEARRTSFNTFVDEQTNMPTVNANSEADRADSELEAAAVQAIAEGESVARQHPGSDDGNPDARQAVLEIATETASDIRESKQTIREDLINLASEFNGGFEEYRTDISNQIDSTQEQLTTGINDAALEFVGIIEQSYSSISQTLSQKEQEDLQKLDQLQAEKLEAVDDSKRLGLDKVRQITEKSINEIQKAGQYSIELIDNLGNNVSELLAPSEEHIPIISAMQEFHQNSLTQLQDLEQEGLKQIDTISNQGNEALSNTQTVNNQIGESILEATSQQATDLLASSTSQREQVLNELITTIETSFSSFETSLDEMRSEALAGIDEAIEDRKGKILQANDEFLMELISQNNENIETAKQPLTDPLVSRLWSAADRATASWWEGMLAAIGDLVVMLVILVAIAAILVAFGVFSTITGALLVIGAVLLAGIFIYSLVTRLREGHGWSSILLALSDTLGITMIYQGVTNTDIATGEDLGMNTFERWHQGTTGTLQFILIFSPFKSRIPGIRNIRIPKGLSRIPGVRGIGRGIGRFVKWIEGVGRNFRTKGGEEQPSGATRFVEWMANKWRSFRNRNRQPKNGDTIVIDNPGRLAYSKPWTDSQGYTHWNLYDTETGAIFTHYVKAKSTSGPDMYLAPGEASMTVNGVEVTVILRAQGFRWTEIANRLNMRAYEAFFGHRPPNLNGQIWRSNLDQFVIQYHQTRAIMPDGTPPQQIANAAIRETSFGRGKIAEGYGDMSVDLSTVTFENVTINGKSYQNVPSNRFAIDVEALPSN